MSVAAGLAGFAGALRAHGIRVVLTDELDAAAALTLVDLLDRDEVRRGLRIALKVPRGAWTAFDRLFDEHWGGATVPEVPIPPRTYPREQRGARWRWDGARVHLELPESAPAAGDEASYSPEALLRRKPFDRLSAGELAAMERLAARLAIKFAARRSRRLVPARGARGTVDLRRSFRHSLATEGEPLRLARRARALAQPRIVLLYDTSGSMDPYTRIHLAFALALRRAIRRTEIFAFNTALTRVTAFVAPAQTARSLERLSAAVPDWSGGTRIGECLAEFVAAHADRLVGRDTTIVVVSDGLDLGDTAMLADAMHRLHERAKTIVWLNPLAGEARYAPAAAGMAAALPFVDHFGPAHDLAALEALLRIL
jgi:uncharacterized protein with von Willebrand factor type A (vWA) domain